MSTLTVSVLQQPLVWMDGEANFQHFAQQLEQVNDSDIIVLPEMFTTGFAMQAAITSPSEQRVVQWLTQQAFRTNALLCGSAAIQLDGYAVNRFFFVFPTGEYYHYDKRHLFRMGEEHQHYRAGQERPIITWRGWNILPQICYDLRFPVFSRNAENEYDLIIYVASWPAVRAKHWSALLLARAIENQCWVIGCNRVGQDANQLVYQGDSQIISPEGQVVGQLPAHHAGILQAEIDLQKLREYRQAFPAWQDAERFTLI